MVPRLLFVHGIGGPRHEESELTSWTSALAVGMRESGHSDAADALNSGALASCRFTYYGDLFQRPQAQGAGLPPADGPESAILAELLVGLVDELTAEHEHPDTPRDGDWEGRRLLLRQARAEAASAGQAQGALAVMRRALNVATTLLSWQPWSAAAEWAVPKLMVRDLAQVARYLARAEHDESGTSLDARVRRRVADALALGEGSTVVVSHSLGTIVALETLHELTSDIRLFVTLGSPISMRTVVWPRLVPQPPSTPPGVGSWLNYWDRDDIIAVRPRLERDLRPNSAGVAPVSGRIDSDGLWVHSAGKYLAQARVAGRIAEALASASSGGARSGGS